MLRRDRVDRVVHGPLHHPHVDLGGRWCSACRPRKPGPWNSGDRADRNEVPLRHCSGVCLAGGAADAPKTPSVASTRTATATSPMDRLRVMFTPLSVCLTFVADVTKHFVWEIGSWCVSTPFVTGRLMAGGSSVGGRGSGSSRRPQTGRRTARASDRSGERSIDQHQMRSDVRTACPVVGDRNTRPDR